jgi:hypothetical protein
VSFNIYVNDIPSIQNDYNVTISLYAVDTNVTIRSEGMQRATNLLYTAVKTLEPWLANWIIKINVSKFSIILFYKEWSHFRVNDPSIKFFHTTINWTNQVK